jgi:DNA-binding response OmpR family regulator
MTPFISELLAETLEAIGHVVCGIETIEDGAVNAAARCQPDLMIVDVRLGEGSGTLAMERILRAAPTPHVFISVERLRLPSEMLQKPFRTTELVQAMQRVLAAAVR